MKKSLKYSLIGAGIGILIGMSPFLFFLCDDKVYLCAYIAYLPSIPFELLCKSWGCYGSGAGVFTMFCTYIFYPIFGTLMGYLYSKFKNKK